MTEQERFWQKVEKTDTCWNWTGCILSQGYGQFRTAGHPYHRVVAHRYSYELVNGPVPDELEVDHVCGNRRCVNPSHLEAVTPAENCQRGWQRRKTTGRIRRRQIWVRLAEPRPLIYFTRVQRSVIERAGMSIGQVMDQLTTQKVSLPEMAVRLGVNRYTLRSWARRWGLRPTAYAMKVA